MFGGALGSVVRYAIGMAIASRYAVSFPIATFLINVTGSFLIGVAMTAIPTSGSPILRPLLVTGMLGGYTTFSAFEWETYVSPNRVAAAYVISSVGIGFLACWAGAVSARYFSR